MMQKAPLYRLVLGALFSAIVLFVVGCDNPAGSDNNDSGSDGQLENVDYEATVTGEVTGSFAGTASIRANNPVDGAYRFVFGVDDLSSEPPTSLAWVFVIDTYNSENDGLAEGSYPISGEIGGTLETDIAKLSEQNNRLLYIDDDLYRFSGTETSPGTLTLTAVTESSITGSFSLTGPFEISTGSSWVSVGEATLAADFVLAR